MPKPGDKVYRVWNGTLEVYKFQQETIAPGATLPTWVLQEQFGSREVYRTSPDYYHLTATAAWEEYLEDCRNTLPGAKEAVQEAEQYLEYLRGEVTKAENSIRELKSSTVV